MVQCAAQNQSRSCFPNRITRNKREGERKPRQKFSHQAEEGITREEGSKQGSAGSQTAEEEGPERWGELLYVQDCQQAKQEAANAHNRSTGGGVGAEARLERTEGSADRK